ncbi:Na+/H+ antiporter NhaC [Synergistaceae bacterium OttesenSCG-928-I11]|nr:Na+/H+ antiporter NhaC [Synergistaceae bacterium OttesenSCG-928-I11]
MSEYKHENTGRKPNIFESIFILAFVACLILAAVIIFEQDVHIPLAISAAVAAIMSMLFLKTKWAVIEEGILTSIMMGMQACLILYTVGMLIGTWIQSGTVPTMIYYGLSVLSPSIFLVATILICSVVALATGTSWGTSGTVGLALMGIGAGLGIPAPLCAGFVISGAYFGDKMSPLSDTTNLAPAMAGTDLFQHIRAMAWTTGPTYVIVLVIAGVFGMKYSGGTLDAEKIEAIKVLLQAEFPVSIIGLLPPVVVIGLAASKKPAIPSIFAGVIVSAILGMIYGVGLGDTLYALQEGYSPLLTGDLAEFLEDTPALMAALSDAGITGLTPDAAISAIETLNELLARGGLQSMNWTISLILCALTFGGILERVGYLEVLLDTLLKNVRSPGGLTTSVVISCIASNLFTGDQYISLVLPGRMFKDRFAEAGLHPRMLSRSLEDSGTLTSVLIPWNTCGAYHTTALGVPTIEYIPYAFLNWLNPIVAIVMTYMGIGISWATKDGGFVISRTKPTDV